MPHRAGVPRRVTGPVAEVESCLGLRRLRMSTSRQDAFVRGGRAGLPRRRSQHSAQSCRVGEGPTSVHLQCHSYRRSDRDCPLRRGIHAAAHPVLRPGGDRLRKEAFALGAFTGKFPRPPNGLGLPTRLGLGRLLESCAGLHFPEDALALHLLLEGLQRLVDVVVPDHDNYDLKLSIAAPAMV